MMVGTVSRQCDFCGRSNVTDALASKGKKVVRALTVALELSQACRT